MHPELFELKALVAGRLDLHRRREIDDHLGSCADCSRHYVAMMLGSSSPKTAEAESREALVSTGATSVMAVAAGASAPPAFGIDAPLSPSTRPAPKPVAPSHGVALEAEFPPAAARTQLPVSASLVDAITKLRAESEAARVSADAATAAEFDTPSPVAEAKPRLAPEIIAPEQDSALIAPSIFTPTPYGGVSLIHPEPVPSPKAAQPAPELVVTFPSAPVTPRPARRSPASQPVTVAAAAPAVAAPTVSAPSPEYVSLAVPTLASQPATAFEITTSAAPAKAGTRTLGTGAMAAAVLVAVVGLAGYKFFQSSVDKAATAAATAAAQRVEAAAAMTTKSAAAPAPAAPAQVQTRIVYVEKPAKKGEKAETKPETVMVAPSLPIAVTLPEVNLNTGADAVVQTNTQRAAASELTRSARATASRTASPRP